ncbi:hypothetical protein [Adhaeribacter rhizoryzae]|uniref:Uncharacterized protein n=1 Tax=Adhaeribacter rhizoryzae TaxID=2607907 RepID=A0A5M6D1Z2_9BACT|nr:hypothetical protein [Adhaeribacter rhizoryzae]KAA5539145.1 hypothetical protein F0145_25080 [Adhaeribacter rhizoryzae]
MKQRNPFNGMLGLYSGTREKVRLYAEKQPDKVIAAMFLILLVAVTIFLITKATHQQDYNRSAGALLNRISAPAPPPAGKPITGDILDLLTLYGRTKAINPDSLTLKDSLLLKEINRDLNKILDEKD